MIEPAKPANEIGKEFQEACRVKLDRIEFVPAGTTAENQPKVVDARRWE